jgi:putative membrane protein
MSKQKQKKKRRKIKISNLTSNFRNKEKIILRDFLSMERTTLANERTLFAYIRTSLYLALGGIGFLKLRDFANVRWVAYPLFAISGMLIIYGIIRYIVMHRKLHRFYDDMHIEKLKEREEKIKAGKTGELKE